MKFQSHFLLQKHQRNVHGMQIQVTNPGTNNGNQITGNNVQQNNSTNNRNSQPNHQNHQNNTNQNTGHYSTHTSTPGKPAEDEVNMIECDMCGKMVRETSLSAHKKRHELAEKRPFKCEICGKVNC